MFKVRQNSVTDLQSGWIYWPDGTLRGLPMDKVPSIEDFYSAVALGKKARQAYIRECKDPGNYERQFAMMLNDYDHAKAMEIGHGNISRGVRLAIRAFDLNQDKPIPKSVQF